MACRIMSGKLFHLFEDSLLQLDKSRVSFQLNILNFVQSKDFEAILETVSTCLKDSRGCLLVLFIFLSTQMIDSWLPDLINRYEQKSKLITRSTKSTLCVNIYCDGEVNRVVGWVLFTCIRKYEKIDQRSNGKKDNNTSDILDMLRDMKAVESEIIQDADYINMLMMQSVIKANLL